MPPKPIGRAKTVDPTDPKFKAAIAKAEDRKSNAVARLGRPSFVNELSDSAVAEAAALTEETNQQFRGTELTEADSAKMDAIVAQARDISAQAIADEVMDWLIANVEEYVDNAETIYRISFTPEQIEACPEAKRVTDLYLSIPETGHEKEVECIDALHDVINSVKELMESDEERMTKLFDRLVFFYDTKMTVVNGRPVPLTIPMDGKITIHEFLFDTVGQTVTVRRKNVKMTKEQMASPQAAELVKAAIAANQFEEVITDIYQPAGFSLELEISYWPKTT